MEYRNQNVYKDSDLRDPDQHPAYKQSHLRNVPVTASAADSQGSRNSGSSHDSKTDKGGAAKPSTHETKPSEKKPETNPKSDKPAHDTRKPTGK